ncbi:MAG: hypothetical protein E6R03_11195 [Hyphomicrobiaceae bacterium]|nr:MAG: hypothetical protein E6R03_11195 [Hyphomicrobiaceae bacterium]
MFSSIVGGMIGIIAPILLYLLRAAGAKEEVQNAVRQAIGDFMEDRKSVTLPGDIEDRALERLKSNKQTGINSQTDKIKKG